MTLRVALPRAGFGANHREIEGKLVFHTICFGLHGTKDEMDAMLWTGMLGDAARGVYFSPLPTELKRCNFLQSSMLQCCFQSHFRILARVPDVWEYLLGLVSVHNNGRA